MLLLPIGTDVHDGRIRMAAVLIMGLCLGLHLFVSTESARSEQQVRRMVEAFEHDQSWAVALPEPLPTSPEEIAALRSQAEAAYYQAVEELKQAVHDVRRQTLTYRLGLIPAHLSVFNLLTYMFIHGGWMHLMGNMLFFYVCGVAMEKYWGFVRFTAVYVACGVLAGLFYVATTTFADLDAQQAPLVGASGAIAGAMGAFVVTHTRVRVRIFYLIALWWRGIFRLPSYVYFGLWFVMQLVASTLEPEHSSGVAYSAHIGGFIAGALFGVFIKSEDEASLVVPAQVMQSMQRRQAALPPDHLSPPVPGEAADEGPRATERAAAALRAGERAEASRILARAIDHALLTGAPPQDELYPALRQVLGSFTTLDIPPAQLYQWGKQLVAAGLLPPAVGCFDVAARAADSPHLRKNSLLGAAATRLRLGVQRQKARSDLLQVIEQDPNGLFAQEAQRILDAAD